jgi:hypothetical protein
VYWQRPCDPHPAGREPWKLTVADPVRHTGRSRSETIRAPPVSSNATVTKLADWQPAAGGGGAGGGGGGGDGDILDAAPLRRRRQARRPPRRGPPGTGAPIAFRQSRTHSLCRIGHRRRRRSVCLPARCGRRGRARRQAAAAGRGGGRRAAGGAVRPLGSRRPAGSVGRPPGSGAWLGCASAPVGSPCTGTRPDRRGRCHRHGGWRRSPRRR